MTNEELAGLARNGDESALLELWKQVRRLAWKFIPRWTATARLAGLKPADMEQIAFLGLLKAVQRFDSAAGFRFSTVFVRIMQNEFTAATGRTERQQADPLRYAVSLDVPASPDAPEDLTLGDLIEDPQAEEPFRHVEAFGDLEPFLVALPENQQAALYRRFWLEADADPKAVNAALRNLRHPDRSRRLQVLLHG